MHLDYVNIKMELRVWEQEVVWMLPKHAKKMEDVEREGAFFHRFRLVDY